ncbi:MAG: phage tail protein [Actinomycetes bacterium]
MSEPFLGEIRLFPYNFAPRGWALCAGQILSISQNTALFSLLGTTYGGNGQTTFALPDLRGRHAVSSGQGPGLSFYNLGEESGVESVTLTQQQMPQHNHLVSVNNQGSSTGRPNGNYPGQTSGNIYAPSSDGSTLAAPAVNNTGGSQPHENRPPYLVLNYCIALEGIYPSRN